MQKPVKLAATRPVLAATKLQSDLRRAGIEPWGWVVHNSIAAAHPQARLRRQRTRNELQEMDAVATAKRFAVVPLLKDEPVGVQRLQNVAPPDHRKSLTWTAPFMRLLGKKNESHVAAANQAFQAGPARCHFIASQRCVWAEQATPLQPAPATCHVTGGHRCVCSM